MDPAVVVIEVAAPKPDDEQLSALVTACNRASERASCVLAEHAPETLPHAVAIVKSEGDQVRVELGVRRGEHSEWHTRQFDFLAGDDVIERWRTVGFAIGTLAQSAEKSEPSESAEVVAEPAPAPAPAPAPPEPVSPKRAPEPERRERAPAPQRGAWFDGTFGAGPATEAGRWRLGGVVRTGIEIVPGGPFFSAGTFFSRSLADAESGLELEWLGFALGVGYPLLRSDGGHGLELRAEALLTRLQVSAEDGEGRSDRGERWLFGGRAGLDGVVALARWVRVIAGADIAGNAPTDVRIAGERVGTAPALSYGFGAGLRFKVR